MQQNYFRWLIQKRYQGHPFAWWTTWRQSWCQAWGTGWAAPKSLEMFSFVGFSFFPVDSYRIFLLQCCVMWLYKLDTCWRLHCRPRSNLCGWLERLDIHISIYLIDMIPERYWDIFFPYQATCQRHGSLPGMRKMQRVPRSQWVSSVVVLKLQSLLSWRTGNNAGTQTTHIWHLHLFMPHKFTIWTMLHVYLCTRLSY